MNTKRQREGDEETVAVIDATVSLATHALDGLALSDEQLDSLCDVALAVDDTDHLVVDRQTPLGHVSKQADRDPS